MAETPDDGIEIVHAPELNRYEIRDGDVLVGFAEYRLPDDVHVDFLHTEVDEEYGGRGLAGRVVEFALRDVRDQGKRAIPHCPYVAKWITNHPEFEEIADRP
ncbi:MAG TPA: GNAT family N-acetyltransferase [Nocardioides sp.]|nr:GNAT family N-acetyltransferase [Nocardioides sp.]